MRITIPLEATCNAGILYNVALQQYLGATNGPVAPNSPWLRTGRHERVSLVSTVFAAISAEAFINEAPVIAEETLKRAGPHPPAIQAFASLLAEVESVRGSTLLKFNVAHLALTAQAFSKGVQPFQDFALLMRVRDELVHMKLSGFTSLAGDRMDRDQGGGGGSKLLQQLGHKGVLMEIEPEDDDPPSGESTFFARFTTWIGTPGMARWACITTAAMVHALIASVPESQFKTTLQETYAADFRTPA